MQKRHLPCIRGEPWEKAKAACLCVSYTALSPDSPPPHKDYRPNESHKKESRGGGSKATKTKCLALFSPCFPRLLSGDRVVGKRASQQQQQSMEKNPLAAEAFFIASTFLYVNQSTMGITLHFIISLFVVVSFEKGHRAPGDHWQETNFAKPLCGSCHFQSNCCRRAKLPSAHKAK